MTNKQRRGGLGRGLGALIPSGPPAPADPPRAPAGTGPSGAPAASDGAAFSGSDHRSDMPPNASAPNIAEPANSTTHADTSAPTGSSIPQTGRQDDVPGDAARVEIATPTPAGAYYAEIGIAAIHANSRQPRQVFDEDALAELTHSVREFGVLQPVVVRPEGDGYELVMGERRLRAATAAGLTSVPAIVRTTADEAMLRDALLENIHRAQLNPLEEAAAYQQLLEEFGTTHDELAQRIGRSRPQVSNTIRLLNLPIAVQRRVAAGVLSAGHARALLSLDDADAQDDLAGRIVAEGLSVRATEELVSLALRAGPSATKSTRTPTRRFTAPKLDALAGRLSDAFDTRVRVEIGKRKGKITVEFATIDDLERIVGLMSPDVANRVNTTGQEGSSTDA